MLPASRNGPDTRAVISKGHQGISGSGKAAKEKAVILASTERAMRLKGGSFGTGEMVRISGREKLELLAEDEMEKAREARKKAAYEASLRNSVRAPFNLDVSMKLSQSQMDAYIDLINALHKNELCYDIVNREIQAQCPPKKGIKDPDPMRSPAFVAEQFAICVHNAYMLASGWTIVFECLKLMQDMGLTDRLILEQLKSSAKLRTIYLLVYDLLKKLVATGQQRLRSIVQNTDHYHIYFKASTTAKDRQEFEDSEIRRMYKSFLDSTIIELCLPGSKFTPQALYSCLNAIENETPKELKCCPQLMWDAVGDLAEAVRLLDLMETPLLNAEGDVQTGEDPDKYLEFALWDEAQDISIQAALQYSSFVNLVHPLTNLKNKATLEKAWGRLNANYITGTGRDIDCLWQLADVRKRIPHFSLVFVPGNVLDETDGSDKALMHSGSGRDGKKKPLAITSNGEEGSDDSMPGLLEVSDSEDEEQDSDSLSESSYSSDDDDDIDDGDDDEYDTEEEEELKKMYREAMNLVNEIPEVLDTTSDNDKYAAERKNNPFLKLLGNLKGRMFSPTSALRTDGKTTLMSRPSAPKAQLSKKPVTVARGDHHMFPLEPLSSRIGQGANMSTNATVEDADDESDEPKSGKKKKKKPKKKKKKAPATAALGAHSSVFETPSSSVLAPPLSPSPSPAPEVAAPPTSPTTPLKEKPELKKPASRAPFIKAPSITSNLSGTTAFGSTTTLPLTAEQKAESARSYVQKLGEMKTKVKTRPDQQPDAPPKKERNRLFSKFGGKDKTKKVVKQKNAHVFGNLKKKTGTLARKLFGVSAQDKKGALKWEQFLQIMRELGFDYDPSTAGSSVRFDPPNTNDRSISFHKPHPDPTLHQNKLKEYRDKLEEYYGWSPEKFQKAMDGIGGISTEDSEID